MKRSLCTALTFGAVLAASGSASAQVWLSDRELAEGRGIRTGNFELHPGIGAEFGYDSNAFYQSGSNSTAPRAMPSALRLRITPSFSVSTLGAQRLRNSDTAASQPTVNFRAGLGLGIHLFFSPDGGANVSSLNGVDGTASVRADFFPGRTWQFSIGDQFQRSIQAGSEVLLADRTTTSPTRNFNTATLEVAYAPGRGTFEFRLGYNFIANIFDNPGDLFGGRNFSALNYLSHDITARVRWRFLPKTAILFDAGVTPTNYLSPGMGTSWVNGLFNSTPMRARIGINGLITEKIALLAMVGYQATFFSGGDNADTVIGQAELRWIISELASLRVGFQRDIQNSFIGNFTTRNRGYLTYQHSFNRRFLLQLDGSVGYQEYGYVAQTDGGRLPTVSGVDSVSGRFTAVRAEGSVFGEYRFTEVFGMNLTFTASSNITDAQVNNNRLDFTRFSAFVGARLAW